MILLSNDTDTKIRKSDNTNIYIYLFSLRGRDTIDFVEKKFNFKFINVKF